MKSSGYRSIFHIYLIFFPLPFRRPDGGSHSFLSPLFPAKAGWLSCKKRLAQKVHGTIRGTDCFYRRVSRCCSSQEWNYCRKKESDSRSWMLRAVRFTASNGRNMLPASILHRICCFFSQKDRRRTDRGFRFASPLSGDYCCLLYFPIKVSRATMYLNGQRFTGGKTVILAAAAILFLIILFFRPCLWCIHHAEHEPADHLHPGNRRPQLSARQRRRRLP